MTIQVARVGSFGARATAAAAILAAIAPLGASARTSARLEVTAAVVGAAPVALRPPAAAGAAEAALTLAKPVERGRRSGAWTLAWMLPAAGAQLLMHESAHALVPALRLDPRLDVSFRPDLESRTFATTSWTAEGCALCDGLASAMPKVVDLLIVQQLGRMKRGITSPWARGLVSALQITALIDFLQGTLIIWREPSRWNDAWYLSRRLEESGVRLGRGGSRALMTAAALGGVLVFMAAW